MKKIIKKMVAVTLTLVMVLAMSISAFAAENTLTVKVKLDSSLAWDACSLYYWTEEKTDYTTWPGTEMTKGDDGYTLEVTIDGDVFNLIPNGGGVQTADIKDVSTTSGTVVVTVAADLTATVTYEDDTPSTGDSTTVIPYLALALVAVGGVTYAVRKKAEI